MHCGFPLNSGTGKPLHFTEISVQLMSWTRFNLLLLLLIVSRFRLSYLGNKAEEKKNEIVKFWERILPSGQRRQSLF